MTRSGVDQIIVKVNGQLPCGCVIIGYMTTPMYETAEPVGGGHVLECSSCGATWFLDELLDWNRPAPSLSREARGELAALATAGLGALFGGAFAAATAKPEDSPRAFGAGALLGGVLASAMLPKTQREAFAEALEKTIERQKK